MSLHDDLLTLGFSTNGKNKYFRGELTVNIREQGQLIEGHFKKTLRYLADLDAQDIPRLLVTAMDVERHKLFYQFLNEDTIWVSGITEFFNEYLEARLNGIIP